MGKENMNLKMGAIIKDSGKIIKLMELVNSIFQVKNFNILENGTMISLVDGVLNMQNKDRIGKNMKENFKME